MSSCYIKRVLSCNTSFTSHTHTHTKNNPCAYLYWVAIVFHAIGQSFKKESETTDLEGLYVNLYVNGWWGILVWINFGGGNDPTIISMNKPQI